MNFKKNIQLIIIFLLLSFGSVAQYYTPAQIATIMSARSANEGDMYLDTTINNENLYIGLSHGKMARIGDTLDEKIDTIFVENDSLLAFVEGEDTIRVDLESIVTDNSYWELNANNTGLESKFGSNTANGANAIAAGLSSNADGVAAVSAGGYRSASAGDYSVVSGGYRNTAAGSRATISGGERNEAPSYGEWVGGLFSTTYVPASATAFDGNDKLFVVGNGTASGSRSNALTLLKDGRLGIGVDGNAAQTATLHIDPQTAIDPLRVEQLNAANANDSAFLVTDPTNGTVKYLDFDDFRSPTSELFFAAEYAGASLDTINGTAGQHLGYMTSNNTDAPTFMNYYEWTTENIPTNQDYDVILRFKVPQNFSSWGVNTIANQAEANGTVSVQIRNITQATNITPLTNVTNAAFTNTTLNLATLATNPGDVLVIIITLRSNSTDFARVGDIILNYNL